MNHHFKRYLAFIRKLKKNPNRSITVKENHHIVPRCMGGSDYSYNRIDLDAREHIIAHLMLAKSFPNHAGVVSAFVQMCNKNFNKVDREKLATLTKSRLYQTQKKKLYDLMSEHNTDQVYAKDSTGDIICVDCNEFAVRDDLTFHTKGKCRVWCKQTKSWIQIDVENFDKERHDHWQPRARYRYQNLDTGEEVRLTRREAKNLNNVRQIINNKVSIVDQNGRQQSIPASEYDPVRHTHILKEKLTVYDKIDQCTRTIPLREYQDNKSRYCTSTKNKVLARDIKTGETGLVTKDEFEANPNLVGQTHGLRTMRDLATGKFVQIAQSQIDQEPGRYVGPNSGKVNVYDLKLNQFVQVSKQDYDRYKGSRYFNPVSAKVKVQEADKMILLSEYISNQDQYTLISKIQGDRKIIYEHLIK